MRIIRTLAIALMTVVFVAGHVQATTVSISAPSLSFTDTGGILNTFLFTSGTGVAGGTVLALPTSAVKVGTFFDMDGNASATNTDVVPLADLSNFTEFQGLTTDSMDIGTFSLFNGQLKGTLTDNLNTIGNSSNLNAAKIYVVVQDSGVSGIWSSSNAPFLGRTAAQTNTQYGGQTWNFKTHTGNPQTDTIQISAADINEVWGNAAIIDDTAANSNIELQLVIPEPSRALLGMVGFAFACLRRRRTS